MGLRHLAFCALLSTLGVACAEAASLVPQEAVYDLTLDQPGSVVNGAEGRIALQLKNDTCEAMSLDYRFVVRFQEDTELTVTDQHTLSKESRDGRRFEFETRTTIDGAPQEAVKGKAVTEGEKTRIDYELPVVRQTEIEKAAFPLNHTAEIIEQAKAGQRIFETRLFDGDNEAEKDLTTTVIIAPTSPKLTERASDPIGKRLEGIRSWMIVESYYNSDSDRDGLPIFETRYRLYENGVSDELKMNFGAYTLKGRLSHLELLPDECGKRP
ncbi:EipB family protein [Aureimonas sp. AU40]|uniref:EipB family protein n=1 Tax=Aureimonas sp. AU40 TaxID=1637747 RepID=UPI000785D6DD|nr:DUF1849 family protein [Aureimonas sp. AU40]